MIVQNRTEPALGWPSRRSDVRAERLPDGSGMLYDPAAQMAYAISASALLVWERYDGGCAPSVIVEELGQVYEAPSDRIARDVDALLQRLAELGLLEHAR